MNIEEYRWHISGIKQCADNIITCRNTQSGNVAYSIDMFKDYLCIARKLKALMDGDTMGLSKSYEDLLDWHLMYEKVKCCYQYLLEVTERGFILNNRLELWYNDERDECLSRQRDCLNELADESEEEYNAEIDTLRLMIDEHHKMLEKTETFIQEWLPYAKDVLESLDQYYALVYDSFKEVIINTYYDKLEEKEEEVELDLYHLLYTKKILTTWGIEPTPEDYGKLLEDMVGEAKYNQKTRIIAEKFRLGRALNIDNDCFLDHLHNECVTQADIELFLDTFLRIAILQVKTKPRIKLCRGEAIHKPLPDAFNIEISDSIEMNRLLREIIGKLSERVGKNGMKTKWSHVKRVMEDEGIIRTLSDTEFGNQMNKLCPQINAENCRTNTKNNEIKLADTERGRKYHQWGTANQHRPKCMSVAKDFMPLLKLMCPERNFVDFV